MTKQVALPRDGKERARKSMMVRIEFDCRSEGQILGGGYEPGRPGAFLADVGHNDVVVYVEDLDQIKEYVEDKPEQVADAQSWLDNAKEAHATEVSNGKRKWDELSGKERMGYTGPANLADAMMRRYNRQIRPLSNLVVHEDSVREPDTTETEQRFQTSARLQSDIQNQKMYDLLDRLTEALTQNQKPQGKPRKQ